MLLISLMRKNDMMNMETISLDQVRLVTTKLLSTKFNLPSLSNQSIARPRLMEKMDGGLRQGSLLTLVCAPAGYGKTTLVCEWIQHIKDIQEGEKPSSSEVRFPRQYTWLTLDQSDNDLGRFLAYFVAALQQIHSRAGEGVVESLQTPRPPNPHTLATWLINDLADLPHRFILVLDDFHLISAQSILDFLSFFIDHQPDQICLVIVSRGDPDLPLARMRARGQMIELRQEELSFTLQEVDLFLKKTLSFNLTENQSATLADRTEGWIAGLQLAALSMRNMADISSFIENFSGGNMHIADFLTDEVLGQQAAAVQTFLLRTSILRQLSAPLCGVVSGDDSSQEILDKLMEENLFLIPLDPDREWYRYHELFADLLRKRLHQKHPELIAELHHRASKWYQENEMFDHATEHALAGKDFEQAAELITWLGESLMKRGEFNTLLRWIEALPREVRLSHPILQVYNGLGLFMCGKPPDSAEIEMEDIHSPNELANIEGELDSFKGVQALMRGDFLESIRLSGNALQSLALDKTFFRSLAADSLGMAYTLQGDSQAATKAFQQVVHMSEQSDNVMMAIGALSNLAGLLVLQGKLREAADAYQRVIKIAAERLGNRSQLTGKALLGLGLLAREWNDLEGALTYYEDAAEMFSSSVEIGLPIVYLSLAMVKQNQGDDIAAQEFLDQAYQFSQASTSTLLDDKLTEETQARFWITQGKSELAQEWLRSKGYLEPSFTDRLQPGDQRNISKVLTDQNVFLTLARLYLSEAQPDRALEIIEPMLEIYNEKGHIRRVIEILGLKALALQQQENTHAALHVLNQALTLAKPEGYRRTFLDEGESMAQLLYAAAAEGMHPTYTGSLLAAFSEEAPKTDPSAQVLDASEKLVEPLSQRELEVLGLIAEGLSNQEISQRLHITLSTVKGHTTQIYGKLNVNNRVQAVARARSLGLIPII